jgi:hypothetical protein
MLKENKLLVDTLKKHLEMISNFLQLKYKKQEGHDGPESLT